MPKVSVHGNRDCKCFNPPFNAADYEIREIGNDGRNAEVSVEICNLCGRRWLRYFYENESFSRSGRWYRGMISDGESLRMTANEAAEYLEKLDWYFLGGSYFDSSGKISKGKIFL